MAVKCGKCSIDFVVSEFQVKCNACGALFHAKCTNAGSEQNFTKAKLKVWRCEACKSESSSVKSNEDPEDKKSVLEAIHSMRLEMNANFQGVQGSIDTLTREFKVLNHKVSLIEEEQNQQREVCNNLVQTCDKLTDENRELRQKLEDAEQHARCANIEVQGLPQTQNENIYCALERLAQVIGVAYRREDVSIAHRLRLYSKAKHSHPPIIIQFISRSVKEAWMLAAKNKRNLNATEMASGLQPSRIFINHQLTPLNKALLGRARRLMRERKVHFAGYFNGKVIVKAKEKDEAIRVMCMEDLDNYDK